MLNIIHCILHMLLSLLLAFYTEKEGKGYLYRMWSISGLLWGIMAVLSILDMLLTYRMV